MSVMMSLRFAAVCVPCHRGLLPECIHRASDGESLEFAETTAMTFAEYKEGCMVKATMPGGV